ncbi:MAG: 50S ribosomal protein L6 [Candidatus Peribacteraceae bacterium]|jgi:large subunit ribosomal protein L6
MSRIGIKPVALPSGVSAEIKAGTVTVKGPKGELQIVLLPEVTVEVDGSAVKVSRKDDSKAARERHGLTRMLIHSMAVGVSQGYERKLEIIGVGYKAQAKGKTLVLNLGHSHPINFAIPQSIEIGQDEKNKNMLTIKGIDKQLVGQVAAQIRSLRPPEPYKGKGVRYFGEQVRRKPGKAAAAKTAA